MDEKLSFNYKLFMTIL